jgi:predicted Fe-Mo cluster-binding NifX family protein
MTQATPLPPVPGAPARRALEAAGIQSLHDLTQMTRAEVLALHGMGPKAFAVLDAAMTAAGLRFAD